MTTVRYIIRKLLRSWLVNVTCVVILTIVLGWNGFVLMLLDAALFRTLDGPVTGSVVAVVEEGGGKAQKEMPTSFPVLTELQSRSQFLEQTAGYFTYSSVASGFGSDQRLQVAAVTDSFLDALQFKAEQGRSFLPSEYSNGYNSVTIISYRTWVSWFQGRSDALGKMIVLDGRPYTIVGISKPGWRYPYPLVERVPDVIRPLPIPADLGDGWGNYLSVISRLRQGASLEAAASEVASIYESYRAARPGRKNVTRLRVVTFRNIVTREIRRPLQVLSVSVLIMMAISFLALGGTLLMRAAQNQTEYAIREALGASRSSTLRLLVGEAAVLALLGTAGGAAVCVVAAHLASSTNSMQLVAPGTSAPAFDARVLIELLLVAFAGFFLAGVTPIVAAPILHLGSRALTLQRTSRSSLRPSLLSSLALLATLQVLCTTLAVLCASGVAQRYLRGAQMADTHRLSEVLIWRMQLPNGPYLEPHRRRAFYEGLVDQLADGKDVRSAGFTSGLSWSTALSSKVTLPDRVTPPEGAESVYVHVADTGALQVLGARALEGRIYSRQDDRQEKRYLVVSLSAAEALWGTRHCLGRTVALSGLGKEPFGVLGVIEDLPDYNREGARPTVYVPYHALPSVRAVVIARTQLSASVFQARFRQFVANLDPTLVPDEFSSLRDLLSPAYAFLRLQAFLLGGFAIVSVCISVLAMFGMVRFLVETRRKETAIRLALGARPARVLVGLTRSVFGAVMAGVFAGGVLYATLSHSVLRIWLAPLERGPWAVVGLALPLLLVFSFGIVSPALKAFTSELTSSLRDE